MGRRTRQGRRVHEGGLCEFPAANSFAPADDGTLLVQIRNGPSTPGDAAGAPHVYHQAMQPMNHQDGFTNIRKRYLDFAEHEAKGVSPLYEQLARAVAESDALLRFIAALPPAKQQPNLVFAAVRHLYGTPADAAHFAE